MAPVSPPSPPLSSAEPVEPRGSDAGLLRKELQRSRAQVRQLTTELADARTELERLRAANAELERQNADLQQTAVLHTSSAPPAIEAEDDGGGILPTGRTDPAVVLGHELLALVLLRLRRSECITTAARSLRVSTSWKAALSDDCLWQPLFAATWSRWRAPPQPEAGLWRQCFHEAHWAATDSGITAAELVKTSWEFVFKGELDPARQEQAHTATFGADGTFVSTVPSAPSGRRPLKYHLCHRPAAPRIAASEDACRFVQVKGYPTLRVSRVGWRWRLENDMVVINEH